MKPVIPRREFLGATGVLTGLIAAGSPLALIAPSRAWAVDLRTLSSTDGATLMAVARTIAPHDKLDDAAYALVIQSIDSDASSDAQMLAMLREGIGKLGAGFASDAEPARVQTLTAMEASTFFKTLRTKTLGVLYATPIAYAYFGYEGEAFSKGGYLLRGFNDLRWLPEVPLQDSGPVPGA
ncbi:MAG TPA: twin-arginine translocation signal domain-containing protein [Steroidobacteraceae bacterium]|jgi:hypothetical protein|nr:twin-arginine translocation signal domain-containing protein [Steroidobacteraceae bacterium]